MAALVGSIIKKQLEYVTKDHIATHTNKLKKTLSSVFLVV